MTASTGSRERTDGAPLATPRPRRLSRRALVVAGCGVVLVAAVVLWIVAFSPVFGVRSVQVSGTRLLTPDQVRAAAKISPGRPLVRLDTGAVSRQVERLPEVAAVRVSTSWPGTVRIAVTERTAVGYLQADSRFTLVDARGVQFRSTDAPPAGLPLFGVPDGPEAVVTGRAVAAVAAALGPQLLSRVASIQAFDATSITVLLADHRVVRWGSADRSADKAALLPALLGQPGSQFDLTNPDQVIVR